MAKFKSVTDFLQWIRGERLYNEYLGEMDCFLEHMDFMRQVDPINTSQDDVDKINQEYHEIENYTEENIKKKKEELANSSKQPRINSLFFRGQENQEWTLLPSVFRGDFLENESTLYNDALRDRPFDFSSKNTILENLIIMQHHGMPTRLLDITSNPLVALYFACQNKDLDGRVFLFNNRVDKLESVNLFTQYVPMEMFDYLENVPKYIQYDNKDFHSIYSQDRILFHSPKINNRVIAQAGTFFIYGHKNIGAIYNGTYEVDEDDISVVTDADGEREEIYITLKEIPDVSNGNEISVLIPKKDKEYILNELNTLNINQASLFLDLDNYCQYIKNKYE